MKKQLFKRTVALLMALCMVLSYIPAASASASVSWKKTDLKIEADMTDRLIEKDTSADRDPAEMVRVSIVLEGKSTVEAGYATMGIGSNAEAMAYRADLRAVQEKMEKTISLKALNGRPLDVVWNMTLVGNIISAWVPYGKLETIAAIPGVERVALEASYEPCVAQVNEDVLPATYPSSGMIGSGVLWEDGYTGAGSRIAVVDTGTDTGHQSFNNGSYLYALQQNAAAKGMSFEEYKASLDLLTPEKIAAVLPELNIHDLDASVTAEQLYGNEKLAFGYNYVDANLNIDHLGDYQGEHGSHVAGISTANRYIDRYGYYVDAAANVMMVGVAPDAQLITMKVFGEESPYDSDYMAAIEDAILLDCDVVNLSLGSTAPGSPYTDVYSELMELLKTTDTVVAIAAGNASNWAATTMWGYLYNDDVSFNEVGEPGSYESAFTVASVNNDGTVGYYFSANGQKAFYVETLGYGNTAMVGLDTSLNLGGTEYDYIFLDGLGYEEEYEGIDVTGKVVFVSRGTLNFAVKANTALAKGAAAVVVYNNQEGVSNMDLTGLSYAAPVVSITQAEGAAIRAVSEDKGTYRSGKITVYGLMGAVTRDSAYYTMSDFSSWGVPGSLTLKPEITAPGGQIYSVWGSNAVNGGGTDKYETMSGTSMATPQITGMAALLAQYFEENGVPEATGMSPRHLAQSLLMSTAQPLFEEAAGGTYYSLLNQGAGLARVDLAAQAESYILVEGQDDGKVKAELGDDPQRTGVYAFEFTITNMTDTAQAYALEADAFRQGVFEYMENSDVWLLDTWTTDLEADVTFTADVPLTAAGGIDCDLNGDGITNEQDADFLLEYVVGNETELKADGDLSGDGVINSYDAHLLLAQMEGQTVTVPAKGTVTIGVELALTDAAKAELDAETPKGTYVEAFVYARAIADAEGNVGVTHSIPMLAFYGDWSEPSMFDRGTLVEHIYLATNKGPYLYYFIGPYGNALGIDYGSGNEYYYGGNPILDDAAYLPERNAFSSTNGSTLTEQTFTLIRGAGDARMQITNADTGEVYFERTLGELYPAYYNASAGAWENTIQYAALNWKGTDGSGAPLAEDTRVNVSLTAVPHYYRNADGSYPFDGLGAGSTMTTTMTIDNTAPEALDIDISAAQEGKLTVKARDNQYVAAVALLNANATKFLAVQSPNQTEKNMDVTVELDISAVTGKKFLVAVYDYANNMTTYEVEMELSGPERQYFTAINANTGTYVTMDLACNLTDLATLDIPTQARAAEYVDGYVFTVTSDNMLCVANDEDLTTTTLIGALDPENELRIDSVADMAYNYADGNLYALVYSYLNESMYPYLCILDPTDGSLSKLCEMPVDVHTLAIDGDGTCYSALYGQPSLYKYTVREALAGKVTYIGEMSYYGTSTACCMAWDHNTDTLYFAYPNTLLTIDTRTAAPTLLGYYSYQLVGLYIRSGEPTGSFDPTDRVDRIDLSHTDTRVLLNASMTIEATVWPWNASDRTVTWTSSDESVATVDPSGTVTAHALGSCTITATSNLDPAVSASCTIETFELEKTLNGLVWDEQGEIWMSEFTTTELPDYTKLAEKSLGKDLAAATLSQDGNIYAASLDVNGLKSELYKLDPETFQPTLIGPSTDGYVDLAPAPGQPGNSLMAVYGGNVMQVDATTGDYYNWYYMFSYNLVALAYVGTQPYTDWGYNTEVDWYFIIDRVGYVYLMGFLEQDGSYYYLEHDILAPGGIYTQLDFEMETPYFGSAYFDGQMLYYSAYRESRNNVTLMAIDVAGGSKACYTIGTFADGVWPVAGLMELGEIGGDIGIIGTTAKPTPVEEQAQLKGIREDKAEGTLTSTAAPMSSADIKDDLVTLNVSVPVDTTNATMFLEYDPAALELTDVTGMTTAFACKAESGKVAIAAAEGEIIPAETVLARLTFRPLTEGETTVTIRHSECGSEYLELFETFPIELGHKCPSEHFVDVNEGDWWHEAVDYVVEKGYMNGMDATHFGPAVTMNRAQFVTVLYRMEGEPAVNNTGIFTDVPAGQFYTEAAYWALENGITTGATATTFNPGGQLTRTELVTFMYRYAAYKGYDISATADLSVYRDESQILSYAVEPWKWAVTHGIVTGVTADTLAPMALTNRAQAATIFQRLDSKFA